MLQSMGLQRVGHDLVTEQQQHPCLVPLGLRVRKGSVSLPAWLVFEASKRILGFLCEWYLPEKISSKMNASSESGKNIYATEASLRK